MKGAALNFSGSYVRARETIRPTFEDVTAAGSTPAPRPVGVSLHEPASRG